MRHRQLLLVLVRRSLVTPSSGSSLHVVPLRISFEMAVLGNDQLFHHRQHLFLDLDHLRLTG